MKTRDSLYETITNDIIAELEQGVAPWVKPWTAEGGGVPLLPYNAMTHKRYRGVNVLILWHASMLKGYRNPAWIGFHQAHALGGHVKKDEKSTVIVYGSTFVPKEERRKPEEEQKRVPFLKKRIVFNVEQTAGLPDHVYRIPDRVPIANAIEHVEAFLRTDRGERAPRRESGRVLAALRHRHAARAGNLRKRGALLRDEPARARPLDGAQEPPGPRPVGPVRRRVLRGRGAGGGTGGGVPVRPVVDSGPSPARRVHRFVAQDSQERPAGDLHRRREGHGRGAVSGGEGRTGAGAGRRGGGRGGNAMSAPFVSFKAVKQAVSMAQILERYGLLDTLKRHGADGLTGPCPIHQGTNKTQFRVSLSKNCWNCFGGCEGGNVLDFVAAMERSDIRKAALLLSEWFGVDSKAEKPQRAKEPKARRVAAPEQSEPVVEAPSPGVAEPAVPVEAAAEAGENPPLRFADSRTWTPPTRIS